MHGLSIDGADDLLAKEEIHGNGKVLRVVSINIQMKNTKRSYLSFAKLK